MITFPHCKINLGLHVLSRRSDGFHNIETCFYPVPRTDILEVIPSNQFSFAQTGIEIPGENNDNLCVRAFRLIQKDFGIYPVKIHLHKIIPMGAGLGGGSADAAFTLLSLNKIFGLNISKEQLKNYAAQVGSDCSFFLEEQPMIGTERGEVLSSVSLSLKGCYLVLIKPDVHVSTAEAYSGIEPQQPGILIKDVLKLSISEWRETLVNDFEKSIFRKFPVIENVKMKLYSHGAIYSSMSGSGACVFGIFQKPVDLKKEFTGMDYWSGELK